MHCLDGVVQYNIKPDSPLPLKIGKGEEKEVNLYIGDSGRGRISGRSNPIHPHQSAGILPVDSKRKSR